MTTLPTTGILDSFTRANGTPGTGWGQIPGDVSVDFAIISDQIESASASSRGGDYWNGASFGPNSEVYCTVATLPATGEAIRLYLQIQSVSPLNAYRAVYTHVPRAASSFRKSLPGRQRASSPHSR